MGVSRVNHPFWGTPISGNHRITIVFIGCINQRSHHIVGPAARSDPNCGPLESLEALVQLGDGR